MPPARARARLDLRGSRRAIRRRPGPRRAAQPPRLAAQEPARPARPVRLASSQLTVLAAAAVVAAELRRLAIVFGLAGHAKAHAGNRVAPRLGDHRCAFGAMLQRRAPRQLALSALDRVLDRRVDLLLHRTITCPTRRHVRHLQSIIRRPLPSRSYSVTDGETN